MTIFFVRDSKHRFRCFMAEPAGPPPVQRSWARRALEVAKDKLMLLPQRILRQERAFGQALKETAGPLLIVHSGLLDQVHIRRKFKLFLHKQRSAHLLFMAGECLVLPIAGLSGLLPGPNVAFYSLVLILILQWQAWRGLRRILRLDWEFRPDELFAEWEKAVADGRREDFPALLAKIEEGHRIKKADKILGRKQKN